MVRKFNDVTYSQNRFSFGIFKREFDSVLVIDSYREKTGLITS